MDLNQGSLMTGEITLSNLASSDDPYYLFQFLMVMVVRFQ